MGFAQLLGDVSAVKVLQVWGSFRPAARGEEGLFCPVTQIWIKMIKKEPPTTSLAM